MHVDEGSLGAYFDRLTARRRFNMLVVSLFGMLGLAMAAAGTYGVMAYTVSLRTREIGNRIALGAQPFTVVRSVLGGALMCLLVGLASGLVGAWNLSRVVRAFLFGVIPHDPTVCLGAAAVLLVASVVAAALPARRAATVDPAVALRVE